VDGQTKVVYFFCFHIMHCAEDANKVLNFLNEGNMNHLRFKRLNYDTAL